MYLISSCLKCAILFIFTVDLNQDLEAVPSLCFIYLFIFIYVWVHVCATPFYRGQRTTSFTVWAPGIQTRSSDSAAGMSHLTRPWNYFSFSFLPTQLMIQCIIFKWWLASPHVHSLPLALPTWSFLWFSCLLGTLTILVEANWEPEQSCHKTDNTTCLLHSKLRWLPNLLRGKSLNL